MTADLLTSRGVELWTSREEGEPCATFRERERTRNAPVDSAAFRHYVTMTRFEATGLGLTDSLWNETRALLSAKAQAGDSHPIARRMAWTGTGSEAATWINLTDGTGQIVRVRRGRGWDVVEAKECPVRFFDPRYAEALPYPVSGGDEAALGRFINLPPERMPLFWGAVLTCFVPHPAAFPIINLYGEEDSGKTTALKVLRSLVDPMRGGARQAPRNTEGLIAAMRENHIIAAENASRISQELSDALATVSTGGGIADRAKYTNGEEYLAEGRRPIVLCGIPDVATSADLRSRTTPIPFPPLPPGSRRGEADFWADFEAERPRLFALVLDRIARAMNRFDIERVDTSLRMSDAARWVQAGEPEGCRGRYVALLEEAIARARGDFVEGNPLASAIARLIREANPGSIGATDLFGLLTDRERDGDARLPEGWPRHVQGFGHALKRVSATLRNAGYDVRGESREQGTVYTLSML